MYAMMGEFELEDEEEEEEEESKMIERHSVEIDCVGPHSPSLFSMRNTRRCVKREHMAENAFAVVINFGGEIR